MKRLLPILLLLSCSAFAQLPAACGSVGDWALTSWWKTNSNKSVVTCTPGSADCIHAILGNRCDTSAGGSLTGAPLVSYASNGAYRNTNYYTSWNGAGPSSGQYQASWDIYFPNGQTTLGASRPVYFGWSPGGDCL